MMPSGPGRLGGWFD